MSARPPIDALAWMYRDVAVGPLDNEAASGDVLTYDGAIEKWKNGAVGGGGSGGGTGVITSGVIQIPTRILDVAFGLTAPDADYSLEMTVENLVNDPVDIIFPTTVINRSTTGFTVEFNATPPTMNYYLRWSISSMAGGGGSGVTRTLITQVAHGFAAWNIIRLNGATYILAQADNPTNAEVVGMVSQVVDANTFRMICSGGKMTGGSGLTVGATYFLSDTVAGFLSPVEPTTPGAVSKPLLIADSATSGYFINWRGMVVQNPNMTTFMIGTDLRFTALTGGGKLEARNPATDTWALVDQWTNP